MSVPIPDGPIEIRSVLSGQQVLDVSGSGEIVHTTRDENRASQQWQLIPVENATGFYYIRPYSGGGALEAVENELRPSIQPVNQNNEAQQWYVRRASVPEGSCVIESRTHSDQVLDVQGNDPTSGKRVILYREDPGMPSNQKWEFVSRRPAAAVPINELVFINHLLTGLHINTQGYVGNKGVTVLMQDRNLLEWPGESWAFQKGPAGTYYVNSGQAFADNYAQVDRGDGMNLTYNIAPRKNRDAYKKMYDQYSRRRCLTFDSTKIPDISEWDFSSEAQAYPPLDLDDAANSEAQRWILKPSGIMDSFSIHPVRREDLAVSPRACILGQNTTLCLLPYLYLSQLFTIAKGAF